jgi:hypothetical protein
MNERIKELALKAGGGLSCIAEPLEHPWKFSERELEKFAELIVKECIDVVGKATASPNAYQALMKHFGVEE